MEETKNQQMSINDDNMTDFDKMLTYLKECLEETFQESFEYETQWVYMSGTDSWCNCLEKASRIYCPKVFKLYEELGWIESDLFDNWLIDCALALKICKPMDEDPNR